MGEIKCSAGAGEKLYTHAQQHIQQSMRGRFDYTCVEMAFSVIKKKVKGKEGGKSNFLARLNEFFGGMRSHVRVECGKCPRKNLTKK